MKACRLVQRILETPVDIEDWINDWAVRNGSAVEIWGDEKLRHTMYDLAKKGWKLKSVSGEIPRGMDRGDRYDYLETRANRWHGWTQLWIEDNFDNFEIILAKRGTAPYQAPAKIGPDREAGSRL